MSEERAAITVKKYRAKDLAVGDVVQLVVHGQQRWVELTNVSPSDERGYVTLTYRGSHGTADVQLLSFQLVNCQVEQRS